MAAAAVQTPLPAASLAVPNKVVAETPAIKPEPSGPERLFRQDGLVYGDWRDDIIRDGYVVVKGAIPRDRADGYADEMMSWIENL
jgi:hypothetical protein